MKKSSWDRIFKRLDDEYESCTVGDVPRCPHICGPYQCRRIAEHVGCHFTYMGANTARWSGEARKLEALYPRKKKS